MHLCAVMGTVLTFQLIYIHANKEIDATKMYRLKNPRTFQDLFYNSTVLIKKVRCHHLVYELNLPVSIYRSEALVDAETC